MKNEYQKFRKYIAKHVVPEGGEVLKELEIKTLQIEKLIYELEAYAVDGRAYCKSTGRVWQHRIDHSKELIKSITP